MLLKEEKINLGRQREFDVVKVLAILFMVVIHVYEELSVAQTEVLCSAPFDVIIQFLGGPLAAPVFMFSLGLGLSYSKHRTPNELIVRGLQIFIFSYILNVVRFVIPYIVSCGFADIDTGMVLALTFHVDILPFAGLTFILTGLLKKWNVSVYGVVIIAVVMQAVGILVTSLFEFNTLFGVFFGGLFFKTSFLSYFPLFQWYIYPALGLLYAKYLRHIEDTDKLYLVSFAVSSAVLLSFIASFYATGNDIRTLFTLADELYYNQTFLHTFFSLACIIWELSLIHFILKVVHFPKLETKIAYMSSRLNNIYIVQWLIIGWLSYLAFYDESLLSYAWIVPVGIAITAVSVLLVWLNEKYLMKKK